MALEHMRRIAYVSDPDREYFIRQRRLKRRSRGGKWQVQQSFFVGKVSARNGFVPDLTPIKLRVRCSGSLHDVSVTLCGRITFHAHTREELRALKVLRSLGDQTCGCLDVAKRVCEAVTWRKEHSAFTKTTQKTIALSNGLDHRYRPRTASPRVRTKEDRRERVARHIFAALESWTKNGRGSVSHAHVSTWEFGISDATHPARVELSRREVYSRSGGWDDGPLCGFVVVPMNWMLRLPDNTAIVGRLICFAFKQTTPLSGRAQVWVRKSLTEMKLEWHDVEKLSETHPWQFVTPPQEWA